MTIYIANVAAMAEFTILDVPETPAPIFAFRALRGAIFGSPNEDEQRSKENASSPKHVQTLRSKISALRAPSLSPSKRRKTNQYASPAKSILRTPGIPTPRRQNTNVTFKDVTPSLSPELARRDPLPKERPLAEDTKGVTLFSANQALPTLHQDTFVALPKLSNRTQAVPTSAVPEQACAVFNFEAYRLSTEKEMKKLVRYGQKMREYARKQDDENTKLRIALDKLQKENEELRQRERLNQYSRPGKQAQTLQRKEEAGLQVLTARHGKKLNADTDVMRITQLNADQLDAKLTMSSAARCSSAISKASPPKHGQLSPLKRKASTQLRSEISLPHKSKTPIQPDPQAANKSSAEKSAPSPGPATARLPLERVAAARERIRLKAELRRKTAATASSPVNWNAL